MNFIQRLFKPKPVTEQRSLDFYDPYFGSLSYNTTGSYKDSKALRLSAVYRCVSVISDSVASLPLEPYKIDKKGFKRKYLEHITYNLLSVEPNPNVSRFTFMKSLVTHVLLRGNAFCEIIRDISGNAIQLNLLNPDSVSVQLVEGNLKYEVLGRKGLIDKANIIHVLNHSNDGLIGVSTIDYAFNTLSTASDAESHASGFFRGGANMAGIINVQGVVTPQQKESIKQSFRNAFTPDAGNPNGVAVLEGNMSFQPVQVSPAQAQMLESRQFSVIEICRFFGVSPSKAFDTKGANYATVESNQLAFLTDTLTPLLEKIELEFFRKLYKPSERASIELRFDVSRLLRADMASQAAYYTQMLNLGVFTTNEIRKELYKESVEGGDRALIQVNLQPLDNLFADSKQPTIDNQLK